VLGAEPGIVALMAERELILNFRLEDSELVSPSDFVGFFSLGEDVVRDIVLAEALEAFEASEIPSAGQLEISDQLHRLLRAAPAPALVDDVRHDSPWLYVLHIPAALIGSFIAKCITPDIRRAWKGSAAQDNFYAFFRHRVFGGAKAKVQRSVAAARSHRRKYPIRPVAVEELPGTPTSPRFLVRAHTVHSVEVQVSDQELAKDFAKRLRE
jgi:hypothetical protein